MRLQKELNLRTNLTSLDGGFFPLGEIEITKGAYRALFYGDVEDAINRHIQRDWGDVDEHDWKANDDALEFGGRLHSRYNSQWGGPRFWIITEADRSVTTILLPEDC